MRTKCGTNAKGCPHCGERPFYVSNCQATRHAVACECGARGPWKDTAAAALNYWNQRRKRPGIPPQRCGCGFFMPGPMHARDCDQYHEYVRRRNEYIGEW